MKHRPPHVASEDNDLLQVMPWPVFSKMSDRELKAIYRYPVGDSLHRNAAALRNLKQNRSRQVPSGSARFRQVGWLAGLRQVGSSAKFRARLCAS